MRRLTITGPRGQVRQVDVPTTFRERMRGLRGPTPDAQRGMLFEHCRSVHTIGMGCPITVAFLDATFRVTRVARTPSGRIVFCRRARHVLECPIGADVRIGDLLSRAGSSRDGPRRRTRRPPGPRWSNAGRARHRAARHPGPAILWRLPLFRP